MAAHLQQFAPSLWQIQQDPACTDNRSSRPGPSEAKNETVNQISNDVKMQEICGEEECGMKRVRSNTVSPVRTANSTRYTVHNKQYTAHSTQYTAQSTQYTVYSTQHTVYDTSFQFLMASTSRTYLKRTPACHTDDRGACIHRFQGHYAKVLPSRVNRSSDSVRDKARVLVKALGFVGQKRVS